jgi:hypothetical protein
MNIVVICPVTHFVSFIVSVNIAPISSFKPGLLLLHCHSTINSSRIILLILAFMVKI